MADYITRREVDRLKGEIEQKNEILEAEKYMFLRSLKGAMGQQMKEELEHPKKPSILVGLKYRYTRWKTIRDGKKKEKKILKEKGDR